MQLDRKQIKLDVRAYLKGKWFMAFLTAFVVTLAANAAVGIIGIIPILNLFAWVVAFGVLPLYISLSGYFLRFARGETVEMGEVFNVFDNRYFTFLGAALWQALWTVLWSFVFIVPGIIKSFAYMFTPFIIWENPGLGAQKALKLSMAITDGHKGELFVMYLSFIGWYLLACITFGVMYIYVIPYVYTTIAVYYEKLKAAAIAEGKVDPADFVVVQA